MPVFDSRSFRDHEQVVFCNDPVTGLKAIVAIHSTALGPAAGGCRFWDYVQAHSHSPADVAETRGEQDAVYDVLRLSRGMSYKNAMAGLRLGGGKSVIIGDPRKIATPELMRAFGRHLPAPFRSLLYGRGCWHEPRNAEAYCRDNRLCFRS